MDQSGGPTLQLLILLFLTNMLIILLINLLVSLIYKMSDKGGKH